MSKDKPLVLQDNTRDPIPPIFMKENRYTERKDLFDVCKESRNMSQSQYLMIRNHFFFRETKKKKKKKQTILFL